MNKLLKLFVLSLLVTVQSRSSNADCVMRGLCGVEQNLYCKYEGVPMETSSKLMLETCNWKDSRACCDDKQLSILNNNFLALAFLVKRTTDDPTCYEGLVGVLCDLTCSPSQSAFTKIAAIADDGGITAVNFNVSRVKAQRIYDACANIWSYLLGRPITYICDEEDCGMENFFESLGKSKATGGKSPFQINFHYTEEEEEMPQKLAPESTIMTTPKSFTPTDPLLQLSTNAQQTVGPSPLAEPDPTLLMQLMSANRMWLAMGLCFLFFALLFLAGIAIHWCFKRYYDEQVSGLGSDSPPIGCYSKVGATIQFGMTRLFARQGALVARFPVITLLITLILLAFICCGFIRFQIVTDPVELWSDPKSRARLEKKYFDEHFGPFYRTEQLIIRQRNAAPFIREGTVYGSVFHKEFLEAVLDLQETITNLKAESKVSQDLITLSDICHKPLLPHSNECGVFSVLEYLQSNETLLNSTVKSKDYFDHLKFCSKHVVAENGPLGSCRGKAGVPMFTNIVFGGFEGDQHMQASAVVVTILVKNSIDANSEHIQKTKAWEALFIETVLQWKEEHPDLSVAFIAERSVEDEISRQSHSDISTVLISYIIMFVYVSVCLGHYRGWRTFLIDLKISLSIGGVLIVLASVFASIGLWSFVGVPATLIIVEVIPFLVLAVGVDNIFIMVQDFSLHSDDAEEDEKIVNLSRSSESLSSDDFYKPTADVSLKKRLGNSVEMRVSQTLGRVGPSIFLSSTAESVAFFCGAMTSMPAVRVFALYAGVSICINFVLQIFAFTALLTLDAKRTKANRLDLLCCVQMNLRTSSSEGGGVRTSPVKAETETLENEAEPVGMQGDAITTVSRRKIRTRRIRKKSDHPWSYRFVAHCLAPAVLSKWVRPVLLIVFVGWICFCVAIIPSGVQIGLDQKLSMSLDSYVLEYFEEMFQYLAVGPPIYFVVTHGHNFDTPHGQDQVRGRGGYHNSLVRTIRRKIEGKRSMLSEPLLSWLDDYTLWSGHRHCCGAQSVMAMVNSNDAEFCDPANATNKCSACPLTKNRILGDVFNRFLPKFLARIPDETCPYGGKAQYSSAVVLNKPRNASDPLPTHMITSHFMAHHTVLKTVDDFIEAIRKARDLADQFGVQWATEDEDKTPSPSAAPQPNTVFPYSVFYVYYEQYLNIVNETVTQLSIGLIAVSVITWIMLGLDIVATLNVVFGVFSIVVSVTAMMTLWGISLNAISLVNLVVCIGMSVEFCAHIVRAFTISTKVNRVERSLDALSEMGVSVLRGITLTKFGGIVVLAFAKSRLFQIFYFRMYLCMVLFGAVVGIIFLPVQLSYFGPSLNRALLYKQKRQVSILSRKGSGKTHRHK